MGKYWLDGLCLSPSPETQPGDRDFPELFSGRHRRGECVIPVNTSGMMNHSR